MTYNAGSRNLSFNLFDISVLLARGSCRGECFKLVKFLGATEAETEEARTQAIVLQRGTVKTKKREKKE